MSEPDDDPEERTFLTSSGNVSKDKPESTKPGSPPPSAAPEPPPFAPTATNPNPDATQYFLKPDQDRGKIGLLLNDIWEVRRLIAQGGMGEVYEGVELNTGETVAIKFLLPQLAADPKIQALFLGEARTLVKLSAKTNTGLVQYRVCANDRKLGETYIVMEYVKGPTLGQALPTLKPSPNQILEFAKLLATALSLAHESDLIHRDISPKNILLQEGNLSQAKLIDFGIAKNLAAGEKTQFGGGFTGTLSYSAPEQFREGDDTASSGVGPWTDVYSLALVILAVANGKPVPMGTNIADAVDKRKVVPDLSALPQGLRPVLAAMLAPDPAKRLRSMPAVFAALSKVALSDAKPFPKTAALAAVGVALLIAVGVAGSFLFSGGEEGTQESAARTAGASGAAAAQAGLPSADEVRRRVAAALVNADCAWLNLDSVTPARGVMVAKLSGAAGNAATATNTLAQAVGDGVDFDVAEVLTVEPQACGPLNAFKRFREPLSANGPSVGVEQRQFRFENDLEFCPALTSPRRLRQARVNVSLNPGNAASDFTLLGLEANGRMQQFIANRREFNDTRAQKPDFAASSGGDNYRMSFCVDEVSARSSPNGVVGLVLVKGAGPFALDFDPKATEASAMPESWPTRFIARAAAQQWTTQMTWYQIVGQ